MSKKMFTVIVESNAPGLVTSELVARALQNGYPTLDITDDVTVLEHKVESECEL